MFWQRQERLHQAELLAENHQFSAWAYVPQMTPTIQYHMETHVKGICKGCNTPYKTRQNHRRTR